MDKIIHYYIPLIYDMCKLYAAPAFITALIETAFFATQKFNKKGFLPFVFAVNIVSNLTLNITLSVLPHKFMYSAIGEILVVLAEFIAFYCFLKPKSKKSFDLLILVIFSNMISFSAGCIYYGIKG